LIFGVIILSITSKWLFALTDENGCRIRMDMESEPENAGIRLKCIYVL
jgi:hypothetical protein